LTSQLRLGVSLLMIAALTGVAAVCALGASASRATTEAGLSSRVALGKALYRTYCGQCHALTAADVAGFGSDNGLGPNGGPGFNNLEVPYTLAIVAVTELGGARGQEIGRRGHRIALDHMTWQELSETANFLAAATATNPHSARLSAGLPRSGG
jgi:mono/diheme cytochrome c family protein